MIKKKQSLGEKAVQYMFYVFCVHLCVIIHEKSSELKTRRSWTAKPLQ